jgi:hypothetical protein
MPESLEGYDLHPEWPHIRDMRIDLLSKIALAEAQRDGKSVIKTDGLEIEVELTDGT